VRVKHRYLLILPFCLMLVACATRYQDMGFAGGVAAEQMTADTFRIIARGNAYTSGTTVQDYALLKAAETTKEAGGTHFMVISAQDASSVRLVWPLSWRSASHLTPEADSTVLLFFC
jgi:hypothetical protein